MVVIEFSYSPAATVFVVVGGMVFPAEDTTTMFVRHGPE